MHNKIKAVPVWLADDIEGEEEGVQGSGVEVTRHRVLARC